MWAWGLVALSVVAAVAAGARARRWQRSAFVERQRAEELRDRVSELEAEIAVLTEPPDLGQNDPEPPAALLDLSSGLFNEHFFLVSLDSRVAAARRHLRPVAVVLLEVAEGVREGLPAPVTPSVVAAGIRSTLRDADIACRFDDGRFALILEDTPENGAVWTVERVRRTLAPGSPAQTLWAGIACYPAHAFGAAELLDRANRALEAAQEWHQDRIEVATSE